MASDPHNKVTISTTNWLRHDGRSYHRTITTSTHSTEQIIVPSISKTTNKTVYNLYVSPIGKYQPIKIAPFDVLVDAETYANRLINELWIT